MPNPKRPFSRFNPQTGRIEWVHPDDVKAPARRSRKETDSEVRKRLANHVPSWMLSAIGGWSGKTLDDYLAIYGAEPRKDIDE